MFFTLSGTYCYRDFFSAKLRFFKQMVMLDFDDGSKYITKIFFFSVFTKKQAKLHCCCHFLFLLPQVILNLFCFFVNSFRFTLHFYVTKAKVSNKPVIWHFFTKTNSILYTYNLQYTFNFIFHFTKQPKYCIRLNVFLNPFFVIFASSSLTRAT